MPYRSLLQPELFTSLALGAAAFRVNNTTCTNNVIIGAQFQNGIKNGLSLVRPGLVIVQ